MIRKLTVTFGISAALMIASISGVKMSEPPTGGWAPATNSVHEVKRKLTDGGYNPLDTADRNIAALLPAG